MQTSIELPPGRTFILLARSNLGPWRFFLGLKGLFVAHRRLNFLRLFLLGPIVQLLAALLGPADYLGIAVPGIVCGRLLFHASSIHAPRPLLLSCSLLNHLREMP